jgi:septum formation protein
LLRDAGIRPEVRISGVDESALEITDPATLVLALAQLKANAVAKTPEAADAVVLGCDSLLGFEGTSYGKPSSPEDAVTRWRRMRGQSGTLHTGHCLIDTRTGRAATGVGSTEVRFGDPTDEEIDAYVATGEPLHVAGAFTLDGRSAPFLRGVDGDPGNVIGLSLPLLRTLLGELDLTVMQLWD